MAASRILRALRQGPMTNRQLQDAVSDHGGAVARDCAHLRHCGLVERLDGRSGRGAGKEAVYALVKSC